jgi:hypothetical protein
VREYDIMADYPDEVEGVALHKSGLSATVPRGACRGLQGAEEGVILSRGSLRLMLNN